MKLWCGSELAGYERYLAARGLAGLENCAVLRFRPDCRHPAGGSWPAMIALIQDVAGTPVGIHRTYLNDAAAGKAGLVPDKASLGPIWGGAVRLGAARAPGGNCPQLVIGEGIETAASAGVLMGLPAWAALSAGNLAQGVLLPSHLRFVVIAADHDPPAANGRCPGREAAEAAARRWRAEGRIVHIAMPDAIGDFNNVLLERCNG